MCEWGAIRDERLAEEEGGGGTALCATGAEDEAPADGLITLDIVAGSDHVESTGDVDATRSERETRVGYLVLRPMPTKVRLRFPQTFPAPKKNQARQWQRASRRYRTGLCFAHHVLLV